MSASLPTVSVVIVSFHAREKLRACLESVAAQTYPRNRYDVIVVDNASSDGTREMLRDDFPDVHVIANEHNAGFSPAVNQGARDSHMDVIALLNNDAVAEPTWLEHLVAPLVVDDEVACVGGLVLDESGTTIDYAGSDVGFHGQGWQRHLGEPLKGTKLRPGPTFFANGSNMAVWREVFLTVGGFDDSYFAYYEDVDLGWRLWVLGNKVWFTPHAVTRHEGNATVKRFASERHRYLMERNALRTIFKNYGDDTLARAFPATLLLTLSHAFTSDPDTDLGDYRLGVAGAQAPRPRVGPLGGAYLAALRDFVEGLSDTAEKRRWVQANRHRRDRDLLWLTPHWLTPNDGDRAYVERFVKIARELDLPFPVREKRQVVIATSEVVGDRMAGPAIRAWEMASRLADEGMDVVLATTQRPQRRSDRFTVEHLTASRADHYRNWADVLVCVGPILGFFPVLLDMPGAIVFDGYDPFQLETLIQRQHAPIDERWTGVKLDIDATLLHLRRADLVLCATPRQRQFWIGQLAAIHRINPSTFDRDPALEHMLVTVPFGLPDAEPRPQRRAIRERFDGIGDDDVVLLWGGGIYDWFDPVTLIRALGRVVTEHPQLKLVFMATSHPNPHVPVSPRVEDARRVSDELGLTDSHVFFNDDWVEYERRVDWFCDADVGVSAHLQNVETEFSFRTRMLDYLWTGLPIVCSEGDVFADLVRREGLGVAVPVEDVDAWAAALATMADPARRAAAREHLHSHAAERTWDRALEPLVEFCRAPVAAADRIDARRFVRGDAEMRLFLPSRSPVQMVRKFVRWTRDKGLVDAIKAGINSLRVRSAYQRAQD